VSTCATCRHWRIDPEYPTLPMRDCVAIGFELGYPNESDGLVWDGRSNETGEDMTPMQLAEAPAIIRPGDPFEQSASVLRTTATFGCTLYASGTE